MNSSGRQGAEYLLEGKHKDDFHLNGYSTLRCVLEESEVRALEEVFDRFMDRKFDVPGRDFCDMSQPFGIPFEQWRLVNAMLPREYYPEWQGNIFERVAASVAAQLFPDEEMVLDYDQLLMKRPLKDQAVFSWHQDLAYWPQDTPDTKTVTVSLALNDANVENGTYHLFAIFTF